MRTRALSAIAVALIGLAACGGDDSSSDTTGASATSAASSTATDSSPSSDAPATSEASATSDPTTDAPTTTAPATTSGETDAPTTLADAPEGALDVCALLTPADLEAAFGSPWDAGSLTHQEQTGGDQCVWGNLDAPPIKTFSITVYREGSLNPAWEDNGITVASLFEDTKAVYTVDEELELGDESYRAGSTIAVLDGDTSYSFDTFLGTSDEAITGLRQLAEQVVAAGI